MQTAILSALAKEGIHLEQKRRDTFQTGNMIIGFNSEECEIIRMNGWLVEWNIVFQKHVPVPVIVAAFIAAIRK